MAMGAETSLPMLRGNKDLAFFRAYRASASMKSELACKMAS